MAVCRGSVQVEPLNKTRVAFLPLDAAEHNLLAIADFLVIDTSCFLLNIMLVYFVQ